MRGLGRYHCEESAGGFLISVGSLSSRFLSTGIGGAREGGEGGNEGSVRFLAMVWWFNVVSRE